MPAHIKRLSARILRKRSGAGHYTCPDPCMLSHTVRVRSRLGRQIREICQPCPVRNVRPYGLRLSTGSVRRNSILHSEQKKRHDHSKDDRPYYAVHFYVCASPLHVNERLQKQYRDYGVFHNLRC